MLNFLKKSGRSFINDDKLIPERPKINSMVSSWQLTDKPLDEYLENHEINEPLEPRSRLSMNLHDIVADRICLSYFIQFLETKNALSLIKFYLDSESFKTVAEKEIASLENNNNSNYYNYSNNFRKHHTKSISSDNFDKISLTSSNFDVSDSISIGSQFTNVTMNCDHLMSNSSMSLDEKLEEDIIDEEIIETNKIDKSNEQNQNNLSQNSKNSNTSNLKTVPELKTLCDLSLRKPLTDDEKSMLVLAENNQNVHTRLGKSISANNFNEKISSLGSLEQYRPNIFNKEIQQRQKRVWISIATDAIRIYRKYLVNNSPYFIDIPATILSTITVQICNQQQEMSPPYCEKNFNDDKKTSELRENLDDEIDSISSKCFLEAQRYILERLEADYLNEFLESSFYCKYIVDILSNTRSLTISDILHSESALFYFMEYLEQQENHRDLLEFWVAGINFRKHYLNLLINSDENLNSVENSEDLLQNDAMILYDKYFSLQANNPLPISSRIRSQIEEKICSRDEEDICKCFDVSIKIVEIFFEKAYFQQFLSSQLFLNYLNDLKSKIPDYKIFENRSNSSRIKNHFKTGTVSRHRKTLSDCSAETTKEVRRRFLSQQNSLPGPIIENSKYKTSKSADMKIDARHLNDPDMLWKRNSKNGLIFGRVNSLGRYERDFELNFNTEEKWTLANGSYKIKNAMRKFVNLPEEKVQEEIAWQIAEMIVTDITNVTLGNNDNDNNK